MRKIGWIMLILLISMLPLHASAYTLDALIGAMEVNNAELRKADEDVVQSRLDVKDAKAAYQPTVELTLMGMYMPNPLIDDITINTNDILAQIGRPPLPQGYDLTIYDGMESTYYNASLSVTQPLVTWGKITNSVHLYEAVAEARALQRDDKENQLIAELKARLSALYYIDQVEGLLDETIDTTESLVGIARSGEEEGAVLSSDVLDAEIEAKQADISKKELEGQKASILQGVRTLTGLDELECEDISYEPDMTDASALLSYPVESLVELATDPSSPALQMLSRSREALEYGRKIAGASMYGIPDLALQLSASYGGSRFPFIEKNWSRKDDWNLMITVAFKTTLWDGGKILNNIDRMESQMAASDADRDAAVDALESAVVDAYSAMDLSYAKISYQELKVENERNKVEKAQMEKELGSASDSDILTAHLALLEEEIMLLTERMSLFQNCYTLYYLTGLDPDRLPMITDGMVNDSIAE